MTSHRNISHSIIIAIRLRFPYAFAFYFQRDGRCDFRIGYAPHIPEGSRLCGNLERTAVCYRHLQSAEMTRVNRLTVSSFNGTLQQNDSGSVCVCMRPKERMGISRPPPQKHRFWCSPTQYSCVCATKATAPFRPPRRRLTDRELVATIQISSFCLFFCPAC